MSTANKNKYGIKSRGAMHTIKVHNDIKLCNINICKCADLYKKNIEKIPVSVWNQYTEKNILTLKKLCNTNIHNVQNAKDEINTSLCNQYRTQFE